MITKYTLYTSNGSENLVSICRNNSTTAFEVVRINNDFVSSEGLSIADYQITGDNLPSGSVIRLPYNNTGSIEENSDFYETHEMIEGLAGTENTAGFSSGHKMISRLGSDKRSQSWKDFNCTVWVYLDGTAGPAWSLPVYPQEFSDSNSANFSSQSVLGRSVDYQIYQGSSRSVSFTLNFHNELCEDYDYIHELVSYIESACYPGYNSGIVQAPEICFTIGRQFKIRGVLESCSAVWRSPIIDNKLVNCDLSVSIKETTGPYSSHQIRSSGGKRGS